MASISALRKILCNQNWDFLNQLFHRYACRKGFQIFLYPAIHFAVSCTYLEEICKKSHFADIAGQTVNPWSSRAHWACHRGRDFWKSRKFQLLFQPYPLLNRTVLQLRLCHYELIDCETLSYLSVSLFLLSSILNFWCLFDILLHSWSIKLVL